jgi:hypothetical protein
MQLSPPSFGLAAVAAPATMRERRRHQVNVHVWARPTR